jgi:hypothetical protein
MVVDKLSKKDLKSCLNMENRATERGCNSVSGCVKWAEDGREVEAVWCQQITQKGSSLACDTSV